MKPLNQQIITELLGLDSIILEVFSELSSTNDYLQQLTDNKEQLRICLAEQQTHGRGRFNRSWYSPAGQNIYLSIRYSFRKPIDQLAGLSLVVGLAITNTLASLCQIQVQVKWPNDIVYEDLKLAGSLIEIAAQTPRSCAAIIGIGINVNMKDDVQHITQPWTSLQNVTGSDHDRNHLCAELITQLLDYLSRFERDSLADFMPQWQQHDYLLNKKIKLAVHQQEFSGIARGINPQGNLLLELSDHSIKVCSAGDTTLIK